MNGLNPTELNAPKQNNNKNIAMTQTMMCCVLL